MLSNEIGKKLCKYTPDYCVFDLETTGLSPLADAVVEISAVKVIGGRVAGEFSTLVNPQRPIPPETSDVNGITDDMVADAPVFERALADFLKFAGDSVLVGHNIQSFDLPFLYRDAEKYWGKTISNDYIDTLQLARTCLPRLGSHRLAALSEYYGISTEGAHRALNDCYMNLQVFEQLGKELSGGASARVCPKCGSLMKKRNGRFGEFRGCMGYPDCKFTMNS